jgi:hypothetical protein
MPIARTAIPRKEESEAQLKRMLANQIFSTRPSQAHLFEFIVRGALAGQEITEKYIRTHVFTTPPYKPESNIARRTIDLVRDLLSEYYAADGNEDLVIIALPQSPPGKRIKFLSGQAYTPLFSYNPRHAAAKEFKLGEHYLRRGGFTDFDPAMRHFLKALSLHPRHVGALLGMAEALCECANDSSREENRTEWFSIARHLIDCAFALAPEFWRTHAARGFFFTCHADIAAADAEFNIALSLDETSTKAHLQYFQFLGKAGRHSESLELAKSYLDDHVDDAIAYAMYGAALCDIQRLDEAEQVFQQALKMDRTCYTAHLGMTLLHLKAGHPDQAREQAKRLEPLVDHQTYLRLAGLLKLKPDTD